MKLTAELALIHDMSISTIQQMIISLHNYNNSFVTISYEAILSLLQLLDNSIATQNNTKIKIKSVKSEKEQIMNEKTEFKKN